MIGVDLGARAISDYLALVEYISDFGTARATRFIEDFEAALDALRDYPLMGMVDAGGDGVERILRFGSYYNLTYTVLPNRVFVLRVRDGRRLQE